MKGAFDLISGFGEMEKNNYHVICPYYPIYQSRRKKYSGYYIPSKFHCIIIAKMLDTILGEGGKICLFLGLVTEVLWG